MNLCRCTSLQANSLSARTGTIGLACLSATPWTNPKVGMRRRSGYQDKRRPQAIAIKLGDDGRRPAVLQKSRSRRRYSGLPRATCSDNASKAPFWRPKRRQARRSFAFHCGQQRPKSACQAFASQCMTEFQAIPCTPLGSKGKLSFLLQSTRHLSAQAGRAPASSGQPVARYCPSGSQGSCPRDTADKCAGRRYCGRNQYLSRRARSFQRRRRSRTPGAPTTSILIKSARLGPMGIPRNRGSPRSASIAMEYFKVVGHRCRLLLPHQALLQCHHGAPVSCCVAPRSSSSGGVATGRNCLTTRYRNR